MSVTLDSKPKKKNRNWEEEVLPYVKEQLEKFYEQGIHPTLRSIFYRLASRGIINNVPYDYTQLSRLTARCRKRGITFRKIKNLKGLQRRGLDEDEVKILKSTDCIIQYNRQRHGPEEDKIILPDMWNKNKKYILKVDEILRVDCFADETRGVVDNFYDEYKIPEELINEKLEFLGDIHQNYKNLIPKWYKQPYYVELWTEKNAMVGTFKSILKDNDVRVVFNRGFDSISNSWKTYERIKKAWSEDKKVRILYCGDLDPSGDAMDETIDKFMKICFDVEDEKYKGTYDFKRIGVLYEHIKEFDLPQNLDPDVIKKLKDDTRVDKFKEKYHLKEDDDPFQYEIDALAASDPAKFKKLILDEIEQFYDKQIYERLLSQHSHSEEQICTQVISHQKCSKIRSRI